VCSAEGVDDELLAVFRDDMLHVERVPTAEYEYISSDGPYVETAVFQAPGRVIADRLDLMGIDAARVLADLDRTLKAAAEPIDDAELVGYNEESRAFIRAEEEMLGAMTAQDWVSKLAASPDDPGAVYDKSLGARGWLLSRLESDDIRWDVGTKQQCVSSPAGSWRPAAPIGPGVRLAGPSTPPIRATDSSSLSVNGCRLQ
jgi:hypothetical protein